MLKSVALYDGVLEAEKVLPGKVVQLKNETGRGTITGHAIFPGIELIYNDLHMEYCQKEGQGKPNLLEINYCREGRCECAFTKRCYCYMSAGDLALCLLEKNNHASIFPTGHYHGITVALDFSAMSEEWQALFSRTFAVDCRAIRQFSESKPYHIVRANDMIHHIFTELYAYQSQFRLDYARIKIIELLLFIKDLAKEDCPDRQYFSSDQVATVRQVRDYMVASLDRHETIEALASRFHMSPTLLKKCFREMYGTSIYDYWRTYRLQYSEKLLREGQLSIAEIADRVGYKNPNKYSSAFRSVYGLSPSQFRKCPNG
ncbi:helix-turn-helix domain-containing protein [Peptococcus simiae]|uniref:helix-turn-helix domain-containing protein n=1 Tax=Peptococcus simiae TaxID=1643805 RepID=UPI003980D148